MKNKQLLSGILALLVCLSCSCKKDKRPEFVDMIFEIPLKITPIKDTVAIGDTLWLQASFPDTIKEHKSGKYYRVTPTNFDLQTVIVIRKLIDKSKGISEQPGFANGFTVLSQVGKIENLQERFGDIKYEYQNSTYRIRIGFITKQKGIACINFLNGWLAGGTNRQEADISFIDLGQTEDGAKRKPILENIYYVVNDGDTHFDLFQQHCEAISVREGAAERAIYYEQKATYTFVVK